MTKSQGRFTQGFMSKVQNTRTEFTKLSINVSQHYRYANLWLGCHLAQQASRGERECVRGLTSANAPLRDSALTAVISLSTL